MNATPTVLVAGYFGFGNTGDEAILAAALRDLTALRPGLQFTVVSGDPADTERRHGVSAVLWTDIPAILEVAQRCDAILLGGGGIFHDYWGARPETLLTREHGGAPFYAGFTVLGALCGRPSMVYAVGVGPLLSDEGRCLTRLAFESADAATVRDPESRELLVRTGVATENVRVTADPAFRIQPDTAAGRALLGDGAPLGRPLVAVCVRHWDVGVDPEAWQAAVAEALQRFAAGTDAVLVFVPFQAQPLHQLNDVAAARAVAARMGTATIRVLEEPPPPEAAAGLLACCDVVVGMRMHSLLFSACGGVPPVALDYDGKVGSLMRRLGLAELSLALPGLSASRLLQAMNEAWAGRARIREALAVPVAEMKEAAAENARVAISLIDGGGRDTDAPRVIAALRRYGLDRTLHLDATIATARGLAADVASLTTEVARLQAEVDGLRMQLEAATWERDQARGQLTAIWSSRSWALMRLLQRTRQVLIPTGSRRERTLQRAWRALRGAPRGAS